MSDLTDHIARIAQDEALPQRVEEAARQTAVLPVLAALGWDCWDGNEVTPEFEVRGGRVDYCLQVPGQRLVLIEVKRTGADLSGPPEEQLLRYAFDEGVPLAALTDGRVWWLYLSTATGSWEQRRFFSIDFRQQETAHAAASLERFLRRDAVTSGKALEEARREFESQERDRRVRAALQEAWKQVLGDPDGLLRDLLAEEVREIAGHRPEAQTIADFLRSVSGDTSWETEPPRPPPRRTRSRRPQGAESAGQATPTSEPERVRHSTPVTPPSASFTGRRVAAFELDGTKHEVTSWRRLLPVLCEQLARRAGPAFARRVAEVRGRTRPYFSVSGAELRMPLEIPGAGVHVEGNLSARQAERVARLTLHAVRGSDEGFRIILAGEPDPAGEGASPGGGTAVAPPTTDFKGRHPAAFWVDGNRYEVALWNEVLRRTCEQLAQEVGPAFAERVAQLRGRQRLYFSSSTADLRQPLGIPGTDLYVEGNWSADGCVRLARRVLVAVRGSDEGFRIELAE